MDVLNDVMESLPCLVLILNYAMEDVIVYVTHWLQLMVHVLLRMHPGKFCISISPKVETKTIKTETIIYIIFNI